MSAWGQSFGDAWGAAWGSDSPQPTPGREGLGGDDVPYHKPYRGWNRAEWERLVKAPDDAIEATLRAVYADLTADEAPISILAQVDAIVSPVAERADTMRVDWQRLSRDYERTNALVRLWQEEMDLRNAAEEEEDDFILLAYG